MNKRTIVLIMTVVIISLVLFFVLEKEDLASESNNLSNELEQDKGIENDKVEDDNIAPDFALRNLEGDVVSLSDYKGKIIFLNFWATWCGYCDQEMPDLEKINNDNDDLVVLTVNVREDKEIVEEYIKEGEYTFPVLLDETGKIGLDYVVGGLPTTYIIDKEGKILDQIGGMMDFDQMNMILDSVRDLE